MAGDMVFVSGTVGRNMETGEWPGGVEAQAVQALKNLAAVLEVAAGGRRHNALDLRGDRPFHAAGSVLEDGAER